MNALINQGFSDYLSNSPLYSKLLLDEKFKDLRLLNNHPFKFNCPSEKEIQTFRTDIDGRYEQIWINLSLGNDHPGPRSNTARIINITFHIKGICQSCKASVDFLLRMYNSEDRPNDIKIQKIGQYPPFSILPEKAVQQYLTDEDLELYKKALISLSNSYGIGAFAYFRRIIENEIKRLIKDISDMEFIGAEEVKIAYKHFEKDHQMSKLIDILNSHLPTSLNLGDNPIKLLYEQLSVGIHNLTDDECLKKANMINIIFPFVIRKINEENVEVKSVREAMKNLKA
jgi:hypothetical protein